MDVDWAALERRADTTTDPRGTPLDPGVRLLVIGLWAHEVTTTDSCEGHLIPDPDPGWSFAQPFVWIEAPAPDPHPLEVDDPISIQRARPEVSRHWSDWRDANLRLQLRVHELLDRFYTDRASVSYDARLQITTAPDWGAFMLCCAGGDATRALAPREQAERLARYRLELLAFARFLREGPPE